MEGKWAGGDVGSRKGSRNGRKKGRGGGKEAVEERGRGIRVGTGKEGARKEERMREGTVCASKSIEERRKKEREGGIEGRKKEKGGRLQRGNSKGRGTEGGSNLGCKGK